MTARITRVAAALAAVLVLSGCAMRLPESEITALSDVPADSVLIVGAVEIDPPLRPDEKEPELPNDIFGMSEMVSNRAVLSFSPSPETAVDDGEVIINPVLGKTFFFAVPRETVHMVGGFVIVDYEMAGGVLRERRIRIPGGLRLDLRPDDRAVYLGTLRFKRDAFNEVVEAALIDDHRTAAAAFAERFGGDIRLRKAAFR